MPSLLPPKLLKNDAGMRQRVISLTDSAGDAHNRQNEDTPTDVLIQPPLQFAALELAT